MNMLSEVLKNVFKNQAFTKHISVYEHPVISAHFASVCYYKLYTPVPLTPRHTSCAPRPLPPFLHRQPTPAGPRPARNTDECCWTEYDRRNSALPRRSCTPARDQYILRLTRQFLVAKQYNWGLYLFELGTSVFYTFDGRLAGW